MDIVMHGFTIISKTPLTEMHAEGIYARHNKTGLEVYHILNDDEENLFSFGFMTPPQSSNGVAHILEHSVLCGSKNYPVKDPFLTLSKQSVKTFLNAMTFPDKTVYPASSIIKADYFNLMSVYGDAVFFPLLERRIFEQEGHRCGLNKDGIPEFAGVVLNEMRGVYGDFESCVERQSRFSLFEGSIYAEDSGGTPCDIVDLSYEDFIAFHKKYYHPSNCMVFLCGNIPTEEQLAFLNEQFLCHFEEAEKPARIHEIIPSSEPKYLSYPAPASTEKNTEKISVTLNWMLPESSNTDTLMDVLLMEEVLFGHDGALLEKQLLDYKGAEDVYPYNGMQSELKHICFTAGLIDLEKNTEKEAETYILSCLHDIADAGIDTALIETALNSLEFGQREVIRSSGPFSLILMRRVLRSWIHGGNPEASLRIIPAFERLKKRVKAQPGYVEQCIKNLLLENNHRTLVSIYPDTQYAKRIDAILAEKAQKQYELKNKEKAEKKWSNQIETTTEQEEATKVQSKGCIPYLSKKDLPPMPPPILEHHDSIGQVPVIIHEQPTNDISYVDLVFPVDAIPEDKQYLLSLYSVLISSLGTDTKDWAEISAETAYFTGGISADLLAAGNRMNSAEQNSKRFDLKHCGNNALIDRDWLFVRTKLLPEYIEQGISVFFSIIRQLSFRDETRIKDTIIQLKNDSDSLPASAGHNLAILAAAASHSPLKQIENNWFGIPQIRFIRKWYKKLETASDAIHGLITELEAVHNAILQTGMLVKVCCTPALTHRIYAALTPHLEGCAPPLPRTNQRSSLNTAGQKCLTGFPAHMQVGFGSLVLPVSYQAKSAYGTALVYAQQLETGILWEKIRMDGGAYGVSARVNPLADTFSFYTYRDPKPVQSLQAIFNALTGDKKLSIDNAELEAIITGTYSHMLQPQAPRQKSASALFRLLNGISDESRQQTADAILSCSIYNIEQFVECLQEQLAKSSAAIVGTVGMCEYNQSLHPYFDAIKIAEAL